MALRRILVNSWTGAHQYHTRLRELSATCSARSAAVTGYVKSNACTVPIHRLECIKTFGCFWHLASAVAGALPFVPYSSSFTYPEPPVIQAEFTANYMQQKYDTQVNNIIAGFAYFSPSSKKVRVDGSQGFNNSLQGSIFDFNNMTAQGETAEIALTFSENLKVSQTTCSFFSQVSGFPLFTSDMLNSSQAVFIGIENDAMHGPLNGWQLLFMSRFLVTIFVDTNNTILRYDFSDPGEPLKTFTTTRFFNIVVGPISPSVFETDCV